MINEIHKDITTVTTGVVGHGVNCERKLSSGVALAIKNKWPVIYEVFMESPTTLGDTDIIEVGDMLYVANCYTQDTCGDDHNVQYASVSAILTSLTTMFEFANTYGLDVNLPKIGSDRGGLSWEDDVLPIINKLDSDFDSVTTNIYIYG